MTTRPPETIRTNHEPSKAFVPTHWLGFEGEATNKRTPMWTAAIVGDANGVAAEKLGPDTWVPGRDAVVFRPLPARSSALAAPREIDFDPSHACLVLSKADVALLDHGDSGTGPARRFVAFALDDSTVDFSDVQSEKLPGGFVAWFCSPEDAGQVREILRFHLEKRLNDAIRRSPSGHDAIADLAFRLQRSTADRLAWAPAVVALRRIGRHKHAEVVERSMAATFDAERVRAEIRRANSTIEKPTIAALGPMRTRANQLRVAQALRSVA